MIFVPAGSPAPNGYTFVGHFEFTTDTPPKQTVRLAMYRKN